MSPLRKDETSCRSLNFNKIFSSIAIVVALSHPHTLTESWSEIRLNFLTSSIKKAMQKLKLPDETLEKGRN